jgi:demethylmenaquinone methyltransferase/2-methoxy-6-polyprenyl-1,4-benzoquinol methylase
MSIKIQKMFDSIAARYDFLNHFLSLGRDIRWRKKAVKLAQIPEGARALDLCGGTGDFLAEIEKKVNVDPKSAVGDFSHGMLAQCQKKFPNFHTIQLDAMKTPLGNSEFDIITNGFGMRNLDVTELGVQEAYRLLKDKGAFVTLEFFKPTNPFNLFFYKILAPLFIPIFGALFSKQKSAYEYLVNSIKGFITVQEYKAMCEKVGFTVEKIHACDGGIAYIVVGRKNV